MTRNYAVDVAVYQPTSMSSYKHAGATDVIVKLTEGTSYFNPKARAQIHSAHMNGMYVHAYHFATFGNNIARAKAEANHFVHYAKYVGIAKGRYLCLDWETGDGNNIYGGSWTSTNAILAFMRICKNAGYKVMLYSGAYVLRNNIDVKRITKRHGTCIWVASYATTGRIDTPNYNYFPSMDNVLVWQFTDNWKGLGTDGNITFKSLHEASKNMPNHHKIEAKTAKTKITKAKEVTEVFAPIINNNPNWAIALRNANGHVTSKYIKTNTRWKVLETKIIRGEKYYRLGTQEQWVPAKYVKITKTK